MNVFVTSHSRSRCSVCDHFVSSLVVIVTRVIITDTRDRFGDVLNGC